VAIGAMDALNGSTPGMSAYGSSKVAAHHYIQTLGSVTGETLSGQGKDKRKSNTAIQMLVKHAYLKQLTALAILPTIIDTPSNRNAMPLADFNQWSKPLDIAKEISSWLKMPVLRPHSGSMIKIVCKKGLDGQYRSEFQLVR
jgi:dihydropteridine reductase